MPDRKISRRSRRRHAMDWRVLFVTPVLGLALLAAIFGGQSGQSVSYDYLNILASPNAQHWMGTDELGRDILERLIGAARASVLVALGATAIAAIIGSLLGIIITYIGGRLETITGTVSDVFIALPDIFFAIVVMSLIAPSSVVLTVTVGAIYTPQFIRLMMAVTQTAKRQDYVTAARSLGARPARIIFSDILPNILPIIIVKVTLTISSAMLLEASLSFLGLGTPPPNTSWGQMVGSLKPYIDNNAWPIFFPAVTIFLVILAANLLGDWLQDHLNPEASK